MHVVTSSFGPPSDGSFDEIANLFCANLSPVKVQAHPLALSSVSLLPRRRDQCGLFVLSAAPQSRRAAPLTLQALGLLNNSAVQRNIDQSVT
jgi:hypothetical protein